MRLSIAGSCRDIAWIRNTQAAENKARVVAAAGIRHADAEELRTALLAAATMAEALMGIANPYGQRYIMDFDKNSEHMDRATWRRLAATYELLCTTEGKKVRNERH